MGNISDVEFLEYEHNDIGHQEYTGGCPLCKVESGLCNRIFTSKHDIPSKCIKNRGHKATCVGERITE